MYLHMKTFSFTGNIQNVSHLSTYQIVIVEIKIVIQLRDNFAALCFCDLWCDILKMSLILLTFHVLIENKALLFCVFN